MDQEEREVRVIEQKIRLARLLTAISAGVILFYGWLLLDGPYGPRKLVLVAGVIVALVGLVASLVWIGRLLHALAPPD